MQVSHKLLRKGGLKKDPSFSLSVGPLPPDTYPMLVVHTAYSTKQSNSILEGFLICKTIM